MHAPFPLGESLVDLAELRIRTPSGDLSLTPLESQLLGHLLTHRGRTLSRERLLVEVWGSSPRVLTRAVDNTVSRLRKKIERDSSQPRWLVSTRGGGYRLELEPIRVGSSNLPAPRDSFVGRSQELSEIDALLGPQRLVTLTGPGGTGKTRLALEVARRCGGRFAGGAWVVDLTHTSRRDEILQAVANTLRVPLGEDPVAMLGDALSFRGPLLLLLDNCDVAPATAELADAWLARAPELVLLATSRGPLRLRHEILRPVRPLPVPPDSRAPQEQLDGVVLKSDAVELFLQRATAVAPDLEVDLAALARVTRLLDGLPLAIELAAPQVERLALPELARELEERLDALASDERDRPDRHRTLGAALGWSWERLDPTARATLAQLSIFAGGFDLDAARDVVRVDGAALAPTLGLLEERSLIRRTSEGEGSERFDLLSTIRVWAAEKLPADDLPALEERHWQHYAQLGDPNVIVGLERPGAQEIQQRMSREIGNLLAGARRAIARQDALRATLLTDAIVAILTLTGTLGQAADLAVELAGLPGLDPRQRCRSERCAALALEEAGRIAEAVSHYEAAIVAGRQTGDPRYEATALGNLGLRLWRSGALDRAEVAIETGRALARGRESQLYGWLTGLLGHVLWDRGLLERARAAHEDALEQHRSAGNRRHEGANAMELGGLLLELGRLDEARILLESGLEAIRESGDRPTEGQLLATLAELDLECGALDAARAHLAAALALNQEAGDRRGESLSRHLLSRLHTARGAPDEALAELEAAIGRARETKREGLLGRWLGELGALHARAGRRAEAEPCFAQGEEILRRLGLPAALADLLAQRSRALHGWGEPDEARTLLREARALAEGTACPPSSRLGRLLADLEALLAG